MKRPLAVTMGEPAGVGPDLILNLFAGRRENALPAFVVYGNAAFLRERARRLGLQVEIAQSDLRAASGTFATALPVIDMPGNVADTPGVPSPQSAPVVIEAIRHATADTLAGDARALVTAPIHKGVLYSAGFAHPGHTEYLAALCAEGGQSLLPVMMLVHDRFRVVPLTIHIPLAEVPGRISMDLIVDTAGIVVRDLASRFGIERPRLAVAGLNPHAGEDGTMGREEIEIVGPALERLRAEGLDVTGPLSADTLFHPPHWQSYDAVVAMYHDQALIPIKTLAFDSGVNVTLGLPIVRTSPDHGTAFALAGTGKASASSMLAAARLADAMS